VKLPNPFRKKAADPLVGADLRILMVCMGNICRSPLAEGVARLRATEAGLGERLAFDSAGTHGYHSGEAPDPRSQIVAAKAGIDLSGLRARRVVDADFARFDWILAMDRVNLAELECRCPEIHRDKLSLFLDFAEAVPVDEVPDPYYGGIEGFETVLALCEAGTRGLLAACRAELARIDRPTGAG